MDVKLVSYSAENRTATIQVGQQQKVISGLGEMNRDELISYLHSVARQEFSAADPIQADLADLVGKNLPAEVDGDAANGEVE